MVWANGHCLQAGKYEIEKIIGKGGFGITYKARHTLLDQIVTIKTPDRTLAFDPDYKKFVKRFVKEAQILAKLCADPHPHIVRVSDLFQEEDLYCLVMDWIPGENLFKRVRDRGALSEQQAIAYFQQIGSAFEIIHAEGIVHRDAHPGNIMLRNETKAVLIDFGLAGEIIPKSVSSIIAGNEAFAPYEQLRRKQGYREPTVDIYTLSASLYYAVTGEYPARALDRKIDGEELVPPQQLNEAISDAIDAAIVAGMAIDPQDRPQSVREWLTLVVPQKPNFIKLKSAVGMDYTRLQQLLAVQEWREADVETRRVMLKVANREEEGWLDKESIDNFSCEDLKSIDCLWIHYSNGHFGFSVQKRIWEQLGGTIDLETERKLGDAVGWRKDGEWLDYDNLTFSSQAPTGHLPGFNGVVWGSIVFVFLLSRRDL